MRQAYLASPKKIEVNDVPKPQLTDKQALLKVHAVGICGSDIHAYHGRHPFMPCPIVLGHEASGEVIEVGADVTNVKIGDRVVIRPQQVCGDCIHCKAGEYNICKSLKVLGCQTVGACSDYYAVDAKLLYQLPENVGYGEGTVIEPLAVGVHAVKRGLADVRGKKVLVVGAGTIGNVVAQSAKGLGAAAVMISDVSQFKLDIARECNIDYTINVKEKDLAAEVLEKFGPDGADAIYECSANENAINQVLEFARKGTNIVLVGVFGNRTSAALVNVQDREYSLVGTLMYVHDDYETAIGLLAENKVNLKALITNEFDLAQIADAFQYIDDHGDKVQKVILNV